MASQNLDEIRGASPPENYERHFVPAIGLPMATDLVRLAALQPGARVLDVACGTGVVARLAAREVGPGGTVAGLDVNPGTLAVAKASASPEEAIEWHEANAGSMPLPNAAFDVVLCQLGLQFMPDKPAALREMRRVLVDGGRMLLNAPGPAGPVFAILAEAMARHVGAEAAGFVRMVFSLDDPAALERLVADAGFRDVAARRVEKTLHLPPPGRFLWQYVYGTPLAGPVSAAGDAACAGLERDVVAAWQEFEEADGMAYRQPATVVTARK